MFHQKRQRIEVSLVCFTEKKAEAQVAICIISSRLYFYRWFWTLIGSGQWFEIETAFAENEWYNDLWLKRWRVNCEGSSEKILFGTANHLQWTPTAGLDFKDRVPILSVLGLPLDTGEIWVWHGRGKVACTTTSIRAEPAKPKQQSSSILHPKSKLTETY